MEGGGDHLKFAGGSETHPYIREVGGQLPGSWIPGQVVRSRLVHYIERSQIDPSRPRVCSVHNPSGPGAHVLTACGLHRSPVPDTHDKEVDCMPCVMTVATGPEEEVVEKLPQREAVPVEADG